MRKLFEFQSYIEVPEILLIDLRYSVCPICKIIFYRKILLYQNLKIFHSTNFIVNRKLIILL